MPAGCGTRNGWAGPAPAQVARSPLRVDSAALLVPGVRWRTRYAPAALRSDSACESVDEARCARHPRNSGARRAQFAVAGTGHPLLVRDVRVVGTNSAPLYKFGCGIDGPSRP